MSAQMYRREKNLKDEYLSQLVEFKDQVYSFIPNYDKIVKGPHRVSVPTSDSNTYFSSSSQENYLKIIDTNLKQLNMHKEACEYLKKDCSRLSRKNSTLKEKLKEEMEKIERLTDEKKVLLRQQKKKDSKIMIDQEIQVETYVQHEQSPEDVKEVI